MRSTNLQAGIVQKLSVKLNIREVLGHIAGSADKETIGHLHNGGLVDNANMLLVDRLGVLEAESQDTLRGLAGDQFDRLNNTVDNLVLNSRVFSLSVLANEDGVDAIVGSLEAGNRAARTDVGKQVESSTKSQVERDVSLANGGLRLSVCITANDMAHIRRGDLSGQPSSF